MTPRISRTAKVLRVLFCAAFVGHFTLVGLLLSPANPLVGVAGPVASLYHNGATYQNWHLFSPDPGISSTFLSVRCWTPEGVTTWMDPLDHIEPLASAADRTLDMKRSLQLRRSMPMKVWSEAEKLNARCTQVEDEAARTECIIEQRALFVTSTPMRAAQRASSAACSAITDDTAIAYELEIVHTLPKRYTERDDPRPFGEAQRIEFEEPFLVHSN